MDKPKSPAVEAYWQAYCRARGAVGLAYDVCRMGDSAGMGDELLQLILRGPKRATACLLRDVENGGEVMATVGGHVVVLDGRDTPRAIWRSKTVEVKPLDQVDDAFAWDEGEGDRTRADWLAMHTRYFERRAETEGFAFDTLVTTPVIYLYLDEFSDWLGHFRRKEGVLAPHPAE
jgi:uncharacterized protein YhfF